MNQQQQQQSPAGAPGGSANPNTPSSTGSPSPTIPTFSPPPHGQHGGGYSQQPSYGQQGLYGQQGFPQQQQQDWSLPTPAPPAASNTSALPQAGPGPSAQHFQQQQQYQQSQQYYQEQQQWQPPPQQQQQPMMGGFGGMGGMGGMGDMGGGAGMGANPYMMGAMMMMQLMGQGGMSMSGLNGMMGSAEPPTKKRKKQKSDPAPSASPLFSTLSLLTGTPSPAPLDPKEAAKRDNVSSVHQSPQLAAYKSWAKQHKKGDNRAKLIPDSTWKYTVISLGSGNKLAGAVHDVNGNRPYATYDEKSKEWLGNADWKGRKGVLDYAKRMADYFLSRHQSFGAQDPIAIEVACLLIEQKYPTFRLCSDHNRAKALLKSKVDHWHGKSSYDPQTFDIDQVDWVGGSVEESDDEESEMEDVFGDVDYNILDEATKKAIEKAKKQLNKNSKKPTSTTMPFSPHPSPSKPSGPHSASTLSVMLQDELNSGLDTTKKDGDPFTTGSSSSKSRSPSPGPEGESQTEQLPKAPATVAKKGGGLALGGMEGLIPSQAQAQEAMVARAAEIEAGGGKGFKGGKVVKMVTSECGRYEAPTTDVVLFLKSKQAHQRNVTRPEKLLGLLSAKGYTVKDVIDYMKPVDE